MAASTDPHSAIVAALFAVLVALVVLGLVAGCVVVLPERLGPDVSVTGFKENISCDTATHFRTTSC